MSVYGLWLLLYNSIYVITFRYVSVILSIQCIPSPERSGLMWSTSIRLYLFPLKKKTTMYLRTLYTMTLWFWVYRQYMLFSTSPLRLDFLDYQQKYLSMYRKPSSTRSFFRSAGAEFRWKGSCSSHFYRFPRNFSNFVRHSCSRTVVTSQISCIHETTEFFSRQLYIEFTV